MPALPRRHPAEHFDYGRDHLEKIATWARTHTALQTITDAYVRLVPAGERYPNAHIQHVELTGKDSSGTSRTISLPWAQILDLSAFLSPNPLE